MGKQTPDHVTNPPARQVEIYERRRRAAELRRTTPKTWEEIATETGFSDKGAACNGVKALLAEERSLAIDEVALLRVESRTRYLELLGAVWPRAMAGDPKAVAEARLIAQRIDKLDGTEAPIKHEFGESDLDRTLRDLEAELGRRAAAAQVQAARGEGSTTPDR